MERIKGGGRVGVGEDETGDGMQCIEHPHRNNPGGICAFCLQEKLGKLVSSTFPLPNPVSSSSSSSPSFTSHTPATTTSSSSLNLSVPSSSAKKNNRHMHSRLPFLLAKKKKKKPSTTNPSSSSSATSDVIFKRSKSATTPRRSQFVDEDFSPRKRNGFWSFLYLSSSKSSASHSKKLEAKSFSDSISNGSSRLSTVAVKPRDKCPGSSLGRKSDMVVVEEEDDGLNSPASSMERKVSRSRSVGCGSRSFSGDFFERISTGLGDCTLRRVESQREGNSKVAAHNHQHHCMKERVRCGGIFGGFMMMTSSSSSSSSSSYWVSSSVDDGMNGESLSHGKGKSWGWALASPMRALSSKTSSKDNKRDASGKNVTPHLSALPSLLTVGS